MIEYLVEGEETVSCLSSTLENRRHALVARKVGVLLESEDGAVAEDRLVQDLKELPRKGRRRATRESDGLKRISLLSARPSTHVDPDKEGQNDPVDLAPDAVVLLLSQRHEAGVDLGVKVAARRGRAEADGFSRRASRSTTTWRAGSSTHLDERSNCWSSPLPALRSVFWSTT
jgi:hypothetical protein